MNARLQQNPFLIISMKNILINSKMDYAALEELDETNFIKYIDILGDFKLTSCAISYMENRYANGIKQMIDVAKKVIS